MWDGASDAIAWADAGNWGGVDYPRTNNDKATIPTSLAHSITTAGAITIGELDMQTGCTADITLGGNMILDDAGSETGKATLTAGAFDANGHDFTSDAWTYINGGTLTCDAGNHTFGKSTYIAYYGLKLNAGTFTGGSGNHTASSIEIRNTCTLTSGVTTITNRYTTGDGFSLAFVNPTAFDDGNGTLKFTYAGTQYIYEYGNTAKTFYNLTIEGSGNTTKFYNGRGCNITVANNLVINDGEMDTSETTSGTSRDLTVTGTTTIGDGSGAASSAKLVCNSSTVDLGDWSVNTDGLLKLPETFTNTGTFTAVGGTVQPSNTAKPTICIGTDWGWAGSGSVNITDLDYRIAATTGGGGVTITSTRCKFPLGATISSGDIVKIAANTASGFKKVEGGGTLQVVRGGGVVILDGIADPVNLQNVALPTALNPAQICCKVIQGVSS